MESDEKASSAKMLNFCSGTAAKVRRASPNVMGTSGAHFSRKEKILRSRAISMTNGSISKNCQYVRADGTVASQGARPKTHHAYARLWPIKPGGI